LISRVAQARRDPTGETPAVHVWGRDYEELAVAAEVDGESVVRLESGGFFTEWSAKLQELVGSERYDVQHEVLVWQVVAWRELGRSLFKDTVVDQEEEEYSASAAWGTEHLEETYDEELAALVRTCANRMAIALPDDVLVMCAWRVFDRQRGILIARYGLGTLDGTRETDEVVDLIGAMPSERERLKDLRVASQAWW
jgi:hypothetical protein